MGQVDTLAIGVDVTWWGGGRSRASQWETIVAASLRDPLAIEITHVFLGDHRNPNHGDPTEPNHDAHGEAITRAILDTIARHRGHAEVIVALDAPLEAKHRPDQRPRRRSVAKGVRAGYQWRAAEAQLAAHKHASSDPVARAWGADLHIQAGSPVPVRIARMVARLREAGIPTYRAGSGTPPRGVIEIFPSEAIWSLGLQAAYGPHDSRHVRAYKAEAPRSLGPTDAFEIARRPLLGFRPPLRTAGLDAHVLDTWIDTIARAAVDRATTRTGDVRKHKAFDDPIDSGIGFLTAVACALGAWHAWGDGTDGTIVGPGRLPV